MVSSQQVPLEVWSAVMSTNVPRTIMSAALITAAVTTKLQDTRVAATLATSPMDCTIVLTKTSAILQINVDQTLTVFAPILMEAIFANVTILALPSIRVAKHATILTNALTTHIIAAPTPAAQPVSTTILASPAAAMLDTLEMGLPALTWMNAMMDPTIVEIQLAL